MKYLEEDKLKQLLQIIQDKPAQRIVHFAEEDHTLIKILDNFCEKQKNDYYLHCITKSFYDDAIIKNKNKIHMQITHFNLKRSSYMFQGIEFDYLITTLDFFKADKNLFLQKCYPIIRTGGNIIIFIPKTNYVQRDEWQAILEEQYYVSTNIIDDLFNDYDIIVSKRMHGWGNK